MGWKIKGFVKQDFKVFVGISLQNGAEVSGGRKGLTKAETGRERSGRAATFHVLRCPLSVCTSEWGAVSNRQSTLRAEAGGG